VKARQVQLRGFVEHRGLPAGKYRAPRSEARPARTVSLASYANVGLSE
jgi:hypothetical protein